MRPLMAIFVPIRIVIRGMSAPLISVSPLNYDRGSSVALTMGLDPVIVVAMDDGRAMAMPRVAVMMRSHRNAARTYLHLGLRNGGSERQQGCQCKRFDMAKSVLHR